MKINEPVTQSEIAFPQGCVLVSKTDTKGIITYCNRSFIEISGYSEDELMGKNHNLVRHPDMPAPAFKDLWDTISQGRPWTGIVKNRAKNGDHYWVKANVSPIYSGSRITEYISVRTQPTRNEINAAEALYRDINAGKASLAPGLADKLAAFVQSFRIKTLLMSTVIGTVVMLAVLAAMIQTDFNKNAIYTLMAFMGVATAVFGFALTNYVTKPLVYARGKLFEVSQGNYFDWVEVSRNDEIGRMLQAIKMTQIKLGFDVMDARELAASSTRIKTAVDSVTTNVMLADQDYNIIYMNPAVTAMMQEAKDDIRELIPNFDPSTLIGTNIDVFHKDPSHQRHLLDKLDSTLQANLSVGKRCFLIIANPVFDADGKRIGTAVEWRDRTEELRLKQAEEKQLEMERQFARENARIRTALDNVSSSVMLADNERNIIYMNKNAHQLFSGAERDIREDLPNFNAANLIGTNIDGFHKDPNHQMRLLDNLKGTFQSELSIGGLVMRIVANPVIDHEGNRLGTSVEWTDRTQEVAVEKEIENIVAAARMGELNDRLELANKEGFFKHIGVGINALLDDLKSMISDINKVVEAMSNGDLTQPIAGNYQGSFGALKDNFNNTVIHLGNMIRGMRDTVDVLGTASEEIASGNNNLSGRTEQQAANLEETAASMEELTSTVKNNSDNAQQANTMATAARRAADNGGSVVSQAVTAMQQISQSSNQIAEIIGVIDEIAFQTNLLALNASVEAARAGEQGRGFAVVATEVRNLASRSAEAAKQIKELIKDSVDKVGHGSKLVNDTGEALKEIDESVRKVNDIIGEIAAASAEQTAGIEQVNMAITNMDEMTQQNAALAEQTSAASVNMKENANQMQSSMAFFKTPANEEEIRNKLAAASKSQNTGNLSFFEARQAHLAWKKRIRDFLDGDTTLTIKQAVSHRDCILGKWLYSVGMDKYGYIDEMNKMEVDHMHMHDTIKTIINLKESGNSQAAEKEFKNVDRLSTNVVNYLTKVEDKVGG
jgi:methyl-accepting chemotaxis protein